MSSCKQLSKFFVSNKLNPKREWPPYAILLLLNAIQERAPMCHLECGSLLPLRHSVMCSSWSGGIKWVDFCVVFFLRCSQLCICWNWKPISVDRFFELADSDVWGFIAVVRNNAKSIHNWRLFSYFFISLKAIVYICTEQ